MEMIIFVSATVLLVLLLFNFLFYKKNPANESLTYLPPIIVFTMSIMLFILSFKIGKFEGMGLGAISIGMGIGSIFSFAASALFNFFSKRR